MILTQFKRGLQLNIREKIKIRKGVVLPNVYNAGMGSGAESWARVGSGEDCFQNILKSS